MSIATELKLAADLLEQARFLAKREPRRPKQASLRRAVSTAYYALFHFLGAECAGLLIVGSTSEKGNLRSFARRALVHNKMRDLCNEFTKPTPKTNSLLNDFWQPLAVSSSRVDEVGRHFCDLQERRHGADYDLSVKITRADALDACDKAERAIGAWQDVKQTSMQVAELFATALFLWPTLSGRAKARSW